MAGVDLYDKNANPPAKKQPFSCWIPCKSIAIFYINTIPQAHKALAASILTKKTGHTPQRLSGHLNNPGVLILKIG